MRRRESRESELRKALFSAVTDEADGSGSHDAVLLALDYLIEHCALRAQRNSVSRMHNRIIRNIEVAADDLSTPLTAEERGGVRIALDIARWTSREFA